MMRKGEQGSNDHVFTPIANELLERAPHLFMSNNKSVALYLACPSHAVSWDPSFSHRWNDRAEKKIPRR